MLIGPYRVLSEIARGGMGVVYRAQGPQGTEVALKVLALSAGEHARRRLQQEVRTLGRLRHPHVVGLLGAGEVQGRPWLALELIEGETLEARLRRGPLGIGDAIRVGRQLAGALAYVHASGALHRDLKPANVLLRGEDALLTDFGLTLDAQAEGSRITASGVFQGTPGYWAPEQALGDRRSLGPWTDVYGLGALLYACLTGRAPVQAESLQAFLQEECFRAIAPARALRPEVPGWLSELCARCLALEPEQRPRTADEVERALAPRPRARRSRSSATPWLLAPGVAAVLVAGALWAAGQGGPAEVPAERAPEPVPVESEPAPVEPEPPSGDEERVRALFERGRLAREEARHADALEAFREAAALDPQDAGAQKNMGLALAELDRPQQALEAFQRAVALGDTLSHVNVGFAHALLGNQRQALAAFGRVIEEHPEFAGGYANRALMLSKAGRHAEAAADYERALRLEPKNPTYAFKLGVAQRALGRLEAALETLARAAELAPRDPLPWANQALILRQQRRVPQALEAAEEAVRRAPTNLNLVELRATCLLLALRHAEALRDYTLVIERGQETNALLGGKGACLAALGRHAEAVAAFDRAIELAPEDGAHWVMRGISKAALGRYDAAEADYARGLALAPVQAQRVARLRAELEAARGR